LEFSNIRDESFAILVIHLGDGGERERERENRFNFLHARVSSRLA
jgi:hypothetical protein